MRAAVLLARTLVCAATLQACAPTVARADPLKAVVFDLEPVEVAMTPKLAERLRAETDLIRKMLTDRGVIVLDNGPQAKTIAARSPLSQCNGCDQTIARALGADIEVTSAVQQASSAIFNLSGNIKDVATNRVLREGVVDIRGESEDVWAHGIKFLMKERLLEPPLPVDEAALRALVSAAKAN